MKKQQKNKKRLLIALLMLVISIATFTTAAYAWFSANTVVTTSGIDVKVTAATGISISADGLNFGKEINMDDIISFAKDATFASTLQLPEELNPVSTAGIKGANTEFSFFRGELGDSEDVVALTPSAVDRTFKKDAALNETNYTGGDYIAFDIYIKSSQNINLKFADTTSITALSAQAGTGNLETGLRLGVLPLGVSTDTSIANQQSSAYALNTVQSDWKVWNPVPDAHHASTIEGYATGDTEESVGYYGANDSTESVEGLNTNGDTATAEEIAANANHYVKFLHKDITTVPSYLTLMGPDNDNYIAGSNYAGNVISVKAGINKVRIYVWLEGNDVDCVDAISISNGLKIALGFQVA